MGKISVRNENGEVIARVEYNANLDYWDGRNFSCGATGRHKGITRITSGEYVLIHGTDWQGERSSGEVISEEEALQEVLSSENMELLEQKRFASLQKRYEERIGGEMGEEA